MNMKRKGLYRPMNEDEKPRRDFDRTTQFDLGDDAKVRPVKPPKGAKRKAKR